jgi:hypothetical protein
MNRPDCTNHGPLILDLLRGKLDDPLAQEAESILAECPECSAWFNNAIASAEFLAVDAAVVGGLNEVVLPRKHHRLRWVAAAAAIVLMGSITFWQLPSNTSSAPVEATSKIVTFDFEQGVPDDSMRAIEAPQTETANGEPLFSDDLENGGAGSWTIHT